MKRSHLPPGWRLCTLALFFAFLPTPFHAVAQYVTLTGTLQATNGLPASNFSISFTPTQWFFIAGTGVAVNTTTFCATSVDGSVVGLGNPLTGSVLTPAYTSGTLPPGNYYVQIAWYTASATVTLVSPETTAQLTGTGQLNVALPVSGLPAGAAGMYVYIGTSSGGETYQGSTTGSATYVQSTPLATGSSPSSSNTTVCKQVANDAGWPTGTGYTVSLADPNSNTLPGYPMVWQLLGPTTTYNLSNGLPYYHGVVTYPVPILASPLNHAPQSINGSLSLTGYNLVNVGQLGVGTAVPGWGIDVEGAGILGMVNAKGGYLVNGSGGTSGWCLASDGTAYDTQIQCLTSLGSVYYQTVDANGTAQTQRPVLNFGPEFALTDSSSPARTTVDLASIVTAGSCTQPASLTYNAFGQLTGCTNGSSGGWSSGSNVNGYWLKDPTGHIHQWGHYLTLTVDNCPASTVTFPTAFTNASSLSIVITDDFSTGASSNNISVDYGTNRGCTSPTTTQFQVWSGGTNGIWWSADGY